MMVTVVGMALVSCLMAAVNNIITSMAPLYMRAKINSGMLAGILNGCCYLGSTLSSYGLGVIADNFGWTAVFETLIGFCVLTFIVWGAYIFIKRKYNGGKI